MKNIIQTSTQYWQAPEIVNGVPNIPNTYAMQKHGYDQKMNYVADYFSLGMLLYEKLYGEKIWGPGSEDVPGSWLYWQDRVHGHAGRFNQDEIAPLNTMMKEKLRAKREEKESELDPSFGLIFDVLEHCLEISVVTRYEKTRGISQRLREQTQRNIDTIFETRYEAAVEKFASVSSEEHFKHIKMELFRNVYVDGISVPGMDCYEANRARAEALVEAEWEKAQVVFQQTAQVIKQQKSNIIAGAGWAVVEQAGKDLIQNLQEGDALHQAVTDFHLEVQGCSALLKKYLPERTPIGGWTKSPLLAWFTNLDIEPLRQNQEALTVFDFLEKKRAIPKEQLRPENLTESTLKEAAAVIVSVESPDVGSLRAQLQQMVTEQDNRGAMNEHVNELINSFYGATQEIPDAEVLQPVELYLRLLEKKAAADQEVPALAKLRRAIAEKENVMRTSIMRLQGSKTIVKGQDDIVQSRHTLRSLESKKFPALLKIYVLSAKATLLEKFQTLKRNDVEKILCSEDNLVAHLVRENLIHLPIRTKQSFLFRGKFKKPKRGLKDQFTNKQFDLKHTGTLTTSVLNLVDGLGAHDLYLLLEGFHYLDPSTLQ